MALRRTFAGELDIPFSALSMFGAKPPSSPTLVASRPYSALILHGVEKNAPVQSCEKQVTYRFFK